MTEKYKLLINVIHSHLELNRSKLIIDNLTTVENFRDNEINNQKCLDIHKFILAEYHYELSWNQVANGINLLLKARSN